MKSEPKILFQDEGLEINVRDMVTSVGDFPLKDIAAIKNSVTQPVIGPALLALLGTVNLGIATQTRTWYDLLAAVVMLGFGLVWWLRGTRHVLTITVPKGEVKAYVARRKKSVEQAMAILNEQIEKRHQAE